VTDCQKYLSSYTGKNHQISGKTGNKFLPKKVCTNVFIKVSDDIAISNFNIRELVTAVGNVHYEKQ